MDWFFKVYTISMNVKRLGGHMACLRMSPSWRAFWGPVECSYKVRFSGRLGGLMDIHIKWRRSCKPYRLSIKCPGLRDSWMYYGRSTWRSC